MITVFIASSFGQAYGQFCNMSEYPYGFGGLNYPRMHGTKFKNTSDNLPFIPKKERKLRYSQFWINTDVVNLRSGPGHEHEIISETYYGNLVFAYAKQGEWVAVSREYKYKNISTKPRWVNLNYLSAKRIEPQVTSEILKRKCSFIKQAKLDEKKIYNDHRNNIYNSCHAVRRYLTDQSMLSKYHSYYEEYEVWRDAQESPNTYNFLPCSPASMRRAYNQSKNARSTRP